MKRLPITFLVLSIHASGLAGANALGQTTSTDTKEWAGTRAIEIRSSYSSTAGGRFSPGAFACQHQSCGNHCESSVGAGAPASGLERRTSKKDASSNRGRPAKGGDSRKPPSHQKKPDDNGDTGNKERPPRKPPSYKEKYRDGDTDNRERESYKGLYRKKAPRPPEKPPPPWCPPPVPVPPPPDPPPVIVYVECDCGYCDECFYNAEPITPEEAGFWLATCAIIANAVYLDRDEKGHAAAAVGMSAGGISFTFAFGVENEYRKANLLAGTAAILLSLINLGTGD